MGISSAVCIVCVCLWGFFFFFFFFWSLFFSFGFCFSRLQLFSTFFMIDKFPLIFKTKAQKNWSQSCVGWGWGYVGSPGWFPGWLDYRVLSWELVCVGSSSICYCLKIFFLRSIYSSRKKSYKSLPGMEERGININMATNILGSGFFFFFFWLFCILGLPPWHMEGPRSKSEL